MRAAGVTVGPVYDIGDAVEDPHFRLRQILVDVEDPELGALPMHNIVPRLSATPGVWRRPAPLLGQHTDEVLGGSGSGCGRDRAAAVRGRLRMSTQSPAAAKHPRSFTSVSIDLFERLMPDAFVLAIALTALVAIAAAIFAPQGNAGRHPDLLVCRDVQHPRLCVPDDPDFGHRPCLGLFAAHSARIEAADLGHPHAQPSRDRHLPGGRRGVVDQLGLRARHRRRAGARGRQANSGGFRLARGGRLFRLCHLCQRAFGLDPAVAGVRRQCAEHRREDHRAHRSVQPIDFQRLQCGADAAHPPRHAVRVDAGASARRRDAGFRAARGIDGARAGWNDDQSFVRAQDRALCRGQPVPCRCRCRLCGRWPG